MAIDRRSLLKLTTTLPILSARPWSAQATDEPPVEKPDYTLRIATGLVELAPDHIISTTLYNNQRFPLISIKY
jgi:hypothetical protein